MISISTRRLPWYLWGVAIAMVAGGLALAVAYRSEAPFYEFGRESSLISPVFVTVGALLASRRPDNKIGWILCAAGLCGATQFISGQYATTALRAEHAELSGGNVAAWLSGLMQISAVISMLFVLQLFPTGRPPTQRWRAGVIATGAVTVLWGLASALSPGPIESFPSVDNPFGIEELSSPLELALAASGVGGLSVVFVAVASLVVRFRRSRGVERQQLKWFVFVATVGVALILLAGDSVVGDLVWTVVPLGLPVAIGVAILRYRLYDIDRIINRTLVYGALTAVLAAVYGICVVILPQLLRAGRRSDLVVAGSTLLVAALFQPARARIQSFIDRRFYRSRFDSARTADGFGIRLREKVKLEEIAADLLGVVRHTLQPSHASLWLRGDKDR